MAINNPYVPGDPFSYDLKWLVRKVKEHGEILATLDERIAAAVTDFLDQHDPVYFRNAQELIDTKGKPGSLAYIQGYNTPGDNGANLYYITGDYNDVIGLDFFITLDANLWAIPIYTTYYVTPEMFDVETDTAAAFNHAIKTAKPVKASGEYTISEDVFVTDNTIIDMSEATIYVDTGFKSFRIWNAKNVIIRGGKIIATIDQNNHKCIDVDSCQNVILSDIYVQDFGGDAFCLAGSTDITVENCTAKNNLINFFAFECYHVSWNNIRSYGGKFKYNVQFKSCQNCTIDGAYVEDSQEIGIMISTQSIGENPNPVISTNNKVLNVTVVDAAKNWTVVPGSPSAVYLQGVHLTANNIVIRNSYVDGLRTSCSDSIISNVQVINNVSSNMRCVYVDSKNCIYDNIMMDTAVGYGIRIYNNGNIFRNIVAKDVQMIPFDIQTGGTNTSLDKISLIEATVPYSRGVNVAEDYVNIRDIQVQTDAGVTPGRVLYVPATATHGMIEPISTVTANFRGLNLSPIPFKIVDGLITLFINQHPGGSIWVDGDEVHPIDKYTAGWAISIRHSGAWHDFVPIS